MSRQRFAKSRQSRALGVGGLSPRGGSTEPPGATINPGGNDRSRERLPDKSATRLGVRVLPGEPLDHLTKPRCVLNAAAAKLIARYPSRHLGESGHAGPPGRSEGQKALRPFPERLQSEQVNIHHRFGIPGSRRQRDSTCSRQRRSSLMSVQLPKGSAPPQCNRCQTSMCFAITIWLVSEPGLVHVFECATCGKLYFRPECDSSAH
jgi:hypothetical protein